MGGAGAKRKPGPHGSGPDEFWEQTDVAMGWVRAQADRASEAAKGFSERASGTGKSALLGVLDVLPVKPDSPYSTKLLRHYVEGSGEPYDLDPIPKEWQDWIEKATKARPGWHKKLNPYNSGLYDLRNSLGHFDVNVTRQHDSKNKTYVIEDTYEFGFIRNDRSQRGRHGFPLGQLEENTIGLLQLVLPSGQYRNPGGFKEKWEIVKVGKETTLYIPQEVLSHQGKPFKVHGTFFR